jgi:MAP/microtubule affinity-regulating kinase
MASATNSPTAAAPAVGTGHQQEASTENLLGHYKLEKTIGQGTYGKVKLGKDIRTGEKVPIDNC